MVLSWEELPSEERPPKSIWLDGKKLDAWFAKVNENRKRQAEGKDIEDPVQNEAANSLIVE